ncbi:MAG: sigma-70 family RNA polymerase sigma factor [Janthinobacterium lividum]
MSASTTPETTRAGIVSGDTLVLDHLDLARALAARYRDKGEDRDDLVQVAFLGLIKAAHAYREGAGSSFVAYAVPTITGELRRHFRDHGWNVRPPRRLQELRARVRVLERELERGGAVLPAPEDVLARGLDVSVTELREARRAAAAYSAVSLDAPSGPGGLTVGERLEDGGDEVGRVDDLTSLAPALAALDERDRHILALRFTAEATQAEIAAAVGLSQVQVSRRLAAVLAALRQRMTADPATGRAEANVGPRPGTGAEVGQVPERAESRDRLRSAGELVPSCPWIPSRSSTRTSRAA